MRRTEQLALLCLPSALRGAHHSLLYVHQPASSGGTNSSGPRRPLSDHLQQRRTNSGCLPFISNRNGFEQCLYSDTPLPLYTVFVNFNHNYWLVGTLNNELV